MKKLLLLWLISLISLSVAAQRITGTVTSANDGEPLVGVGVSVKGTTTGTSTDIDGKFSLALPAENAVLVFSYLGYSTKEISVNRNQGTVDVALNEDLQHLDEVVVVGYGTMKKSDLSGASASIGESQIKGSIITNIDQALQGRVAGVTSVMTSGAPGSSVSIRVRGQATINAGAEPLYVVDGVIWQGGETNSNGLGLGLGNGKASSISPLSTLSPSDIVSMEILKDASATAIYGAQGSNGVVLITTKRGKAGEAKFTYEGLYGIQQQAKRLDMMNLRQYATYANAILSQTSGGSEQPEYSDPSILGAGTNWQDAIFRTAPISQHSFSAQGGTELAKYFLSGSMMNQDGTLIGTDFKRYSFRANIDANIKKWLTVGLNAMYSSSKEHLARAEGTEGVLTYSLQTPPDIPIYDEYGEYATTVRQGYTTINPIAIANLDENLLDRQKLNGNIYIDVKPFSYLTWHSELDYDISGSRSEAWRPSYYFGETVRRVDPTDQWQRNNNLWWAMKNYITYDNTFGKHHLTAMLGQEAWESNWEWQRIFGDELPGNEIKNPALGNNSLQAFTDGMGDAAMASFFTRWNYNFDDRYLMTYTFRRDGSSNFGPNNRWANFHSVAASWRFTNEAFLRNSAFLSNGKLRIGWGQTGNSNIDGGLWDASLSMFPTGLGTGYKQAQIANPSIKWETQEQWNFGLDLGFFHDRINLTIDAYDKTSNDLLMQLQLPTYFGSRGNANSALTAPMGNFGTINNKGLEISLNTRNIDTRNLKWSSDFQISFNKNKLVALQGTDASGIEGYGQWSDIICLSPVGGSLYQFYGYIADGVYKDKADIQTHLWGEIPENGYDRYSTVFPGDIKYRDLNGDGKITTDDRTFIGSPLPDFTYGFNNTVTFKDFDFTVFLQGSYGNKVFNALDRQLTGMGYWTNQLEKVMDFANLVPIDPNKQYPIDNPYREDPKYVFNAWYEDVDNVTVSNPNTTIPRAKRETSSYDNTRISTRYIEDGSYLRVKNIVLGYSLPKTLLKRVKVDNIRVYANIQNLYTFTKYSGYDPEVGVNPQDATGYTFGFDLGRYPAPRTVSFGVNVSF
ncbi:MAG: TonB-dependent receptor [Dysgonamonadaceae bacterium]|jgi:TonB-linked SusC/RagA family outer membrane protein|nr:TonB-dependent receptor [Dysgonamonadaceae bacterium]